MRCCHKIQCISYKDPITNKEICAKIQQTTGLSKDLIIVKRCKLKWYGHVSHLWGLTKTILQGTMKGGRRQGRQKKKWEDNIRESTGLVFAKSQRAVENREKWRKLVVRSSVMPQWPSRLKDRWRWKWRHAVTLLPKADVPTEFSSVQPMLYIIPFLIEPAGSEGGGGVGWGVHEEQWQQRPTSLFCWRPFWAVLAETGCSVFDAIHPAVPLATTALPIEWSFYINNTVMYSCTVMYRHWHTRWCTDTWWQEWRVEVLAERSCATGITFLQSDQMTSWFVYGKVVM